MLTQSNQTALKSNMVSFSYLLLISANISFNRFSWWIQKLKSLPLLDSAVLLLDQGFLLDAIQLFQKCWLNDDWLEQLRIKKAIINQRVYFCRWDQNADIDAKRAGLKIYELDRRQVMKALIMFSEDGKQEVTCTSLLIKTSDNMKSIMFGQTFSSTLIILLVEFNSKGRQEEYQNLQNFKQFVNKQTEPVNLNFQLNKLLQIPFIQPVVQNKLYNFFSFLFHILYSHCQSLQIHAYILIFGKLQNTYLWTLPQNKTSTLILRPQSPINRMLGHSRMRQIEL